MHREVLDLLGLGDFPVVLDLLGLGEVVPLARDDRGVTFCATYDASAKADGRDLRVPGITARGILK